MVGCNLVFPIFFCLCSFVEGVEERMCKEIEDSLGELALTFHQMGPGAGTQPSGH